MPRPTKSDLLSGKFSFDGSSFIQVAAKPGIDFDTLQYSFDGSPFYGVEDTAVSADNIQSVSGVSYASVSKVMVVAKASLSKIAGVVV